MVKLGPQSLTWVVAVSDVIMSQRQPHRLVARHDLYFDALAQSPKAPVVAGSY